MRQRVITAVVALLIFIPIIIMGGIWIEIAGLVLAGVAMSEVLMMKKIILISPEAIISIVGTLFLVEAGNWFDGLPKQFNAQFIFFLFVIALLVRMIFSHNRLSFDDVGVLTLSMLYIGYGFSLFIAARGAGLYMLLYVLFIVWTTDSGAYIFGRQFGKNKLSPLISPNKTWEGSIGGTVAATVVGGVFAALVHFPHSLLVMILVTIILSVSGQLGDLIESSLKRFYGVKDSGKILPGHGGILDRFDSLLLVLPIAHLLGLF
ncbi:phosphatidate cytidylyltransferase [Pediococcus argentinicus]|uniref:phosphatidate cytidylyltransferase n=1 Tax=Pediococcus argentinicus TaxID=480391 RepID=UPI00338FA7FA